MARYPIVLASKSPRRKELLAQLVPEFEILDARVNEAALTTSDPWETAVRLAQAKAEAVFSRRPECLVLGGDTVVAVPKEHGDFEQLAKPHGKREARWMLGELSGREHLVITGVCLSWPGGQEAFSVTTHVRFRQLNADEIEDYIETGEPMDKAGAYAIQGGAKGFVESIEGSETNVIGLPIEAVAQALTRIEVV